MGLIKYGGSLKKIFFLKKYNMLIIIYFILYYKFILKFFKNIFNLLNIIYKTI